ncbi:hypothetical protein SOVF_211920 isoform A [Spinacia oleracea]|nr:hypothetical protein SOVF_211920 isoform A [Spinacia oleracea]
MDVDNSGVLFPQTSLGFIESLTMPHFQEVVISADVRCTDCQKRILDMISRFDETESVVVSLSDKKVIITCKYIKGSRKQIITRQNNIFGKVSLFKRIFGSSRT